MNPEWILIESPPHQRISVEGWWSGSEGRQAQNYIALIPVSRYIMDPDQFDRQRRTYFTVAGRNYQQHGDMILDEHGHLIGYDGHQILEPTKEWWDSLPKPK